MKKAVMLVAGLIMISVSYGQNVNIPDTAFLHALFEVGVDTDNDSFISTSEAEAITSLDVSYEGITDLTGIKAFVNLDTLICNDTRLTSLDLTNNNALKYLSVTTASSDWGWEVWGQLTYLDISACTALEWLDCGYNALTNLDVSVCTALTGLDCAENQLTSLDVSACIALTELQCGGNQLTNFDVSSNTALKKLYCGGNQLTSLDVSGFTALTWLACSGNQLSSLNITGCTALTGLLCAENQLISLDITTCTALTELYCWTNQLTSLDLSNHDNLVDIRLTDMPILHEVCVWEGFDTELLWYFDTTGSPYICFETDCNGVCGISEIEENWTYYTEEDGLVDNSVLSIAIDDEGNKWFGTLEGLSKFDDASWTSYTFLGGTYISEVVATNNSLWVIGSYNYWEYTWFPYLVKYEEDQWDCYTGDSLPEEYLYFFEDFDSWTHFSNEEAFRNKIRASTLDREGNLWIGCNGRVSKFEGEHWTSLTMEDGLPELRKGYHVAFDQENDLWITSESGLSRYDGENWTTYPLDGVVDFLNVFIYSMAVDQEGNIWIGTNAGASLFDGENWTSFTTEDGLVSNNVRVIEVDGHGNIWFGTYHGGVSSFDGDTWNTSIENEPESDYNWIESIAFDAEGYIWIGTYNKGVITNKEPQSSTSVNKPMNINDGNVTIYPNPALASIIIEAETSGTYAIDITSLNGQLILKKAFYGNRYLVDLSSFPNGVYFITIRSKDFVITRKILKQ